MKDVFICAALGFLIVWNVLTLWQITAIKTTLEKPRPCAFVEATRVR